MQIIEIKLINSNRHAKTLLSTYSGEQQINDSKRLLAVIIFNRTKSLTPTPQEHMYIRFRYSTLCTLYRIYFDFDPINAHH